MGHPKSVQMSRIKKNLNVCFKIYSCWYRSEWSQSWIHTPWTLSSLSSFFPLEVESKSRIEAQRSCTNKVWLLKIFRLITWEVILSGMIFAGLLQQIDETTVMNLSLLGPIERVPVWQACKSWGYGGHWKIFLAPFPYIALTSEFRLHRWRC